jgi:uncharacterized protein YdaT
VPWNEQRYPNAMKRLPPRVRRKAIEIANALLKESHDEGRCIRIAIWRARRWGSGHTGAMAGARALP